MYHSNILDVNGEKMLGNRDQGIGIRGLGNSDGDY